MNILMFIAGGVIFTIFIVGILWEAKNEKKVMAKNYEHYGGEGCNQIERFEREWKEEGVYTQLKYKGCEDFGKHLEDSEND